MVLIRCPLLTPLVVLAATLAAHSAETVVYREDFNANPGAAFPAWSSMLITYESRVDPANRGMVHPPAITNVESPRGGRRFLGEFGGPRLDPTARTRVRQAVRLKLEKLPPHTRVTVRFDLLVLKSWDGSSPRYGPDRWSVRVVDGPTLLDTTFSNNPKLDTDQSFQDYPTKRSRPHAGASAGGTLGYTFFGDSTYHLEFTVPHAADALTLEFAGDLFEGKGTDDESWGLDDVQVSVGVADGDGDGDSKGRRDRAGGASTSPTTPEMP
jgi:hypothetical protein